MSSKVQVHYQEDPETAGVASPKSVDSALLPDNMTQRRVGKIRPMIVERSEDYSDDDLFSEMVFACNVKETENGKYELYTPYIVTNYDKGITRSNPSSVIYTDYKTNKRTLVRHTGQAPYEILRTELGKRWSPDIENMTFRYAIEGVKITIWFHENEWHFSTARRIEGLKGRWASKRTFGERLKDVLSASYSKHQAKDLEPTRKTDSEDDDEDIMDVFLSTLDKDVIYEIILPHDEDERVVCHVSPYNCQLLFLIGVYKARTFETLEINDHESIFLTVQSPLSFEDVGYLRAYLFDMNHFDSPGLIGYHSSGYKVKIILDLYMEMVKLRGNQPSLKFRYLQLRSTPELNMFIELYSSESETFGQIEAEIFSLKTYILEAYNNRYTRRRFISREEWNSFIIPSCFPIVKMCHNIYKNSSSKHRITFEVVSKLINEFEPSKINHILKSWRNYQKDPEGALQKFKERGDAMRAEREREL